MGSEHGGARLLLPRVEGRPRAARGVGLWVVIIVTVMAAGVWGATPAAAQTSSPAQPRDDVRALLWALAADSMEGRRAATPGAARAARFLAGQLQGLGVSPAGDSGYFQRVPMARDTTAEGRPRLVLLPALADRDTVPPGRRATGANVVGIVRGSDRAGSREAVVVGAHFDHVGIGPPVDGDSIYNGADDDASGVVAVLQIARQLARDPSTKRDVVLLLTTGEETGLLGTRWYLEHPVVPLDRTVADLQIEMIARPDSLVGGSGRGWLTGFERSTMGDMIEEAGLPIRPDPRPEFHFFERSDNIAFAWRGIPAHTLSSYGLHDDYHKPSDEADRADIDHMSAVIEAAIRLVRRLADGESPVWHPGGQPIRRGA